MPWPDEPIPVALVITELDVGGAEKALVSLATHLDRRRWSPHVIALGPDAPLAAPLRDAAIPCECLGVNPRRPDLAVRRLAQALRSVRPAVVQSFLFHANVATRLAVPLSGTSPWVLGGIRVAERQKRWHLRLERLTSHLSAGAVCVSEGVRRFSLEHGGWAPDRLTVIPNAVDPRVFDSAVPVDRASINVPDGAFLALYVGRLSVQKGLPTLLDAFDAFLAARPDLDAHLALAGDGPQRAGLAADAASRPRLLGRIHWLGHRSDIPGLLLASDLFVLPSLWEGMPNALLEAMAARLASVATNVEGTEDLIVPGSTGWLVPAGSPDAFTAALLDAASDLNRLHRFGQAARDRVEEEFSPGSTSAAYERLWAGVVGLMFEV